MFLDPIIQRMTLDYSQYTAGLQQVENSLNMFYRRMQYRTFNATLQFLGSMTKMVTEFDNIMNGVMDTMESGSDSIRREIERTILQLSSNSLTAPVELAKAYLEMGRSGMSAAASIEALSTVERFAYLNHIKAADAARDLIGLQRALGRESNNAVENARNLQRIGDIITNVALHAQVPQNQFFHAVHQMAPAIGNMNRGLEDSVAILATFTANNMSATQASTATAGIMREMQHLVDRDNHARSSAARMGNAHALSVHPLHGITSSTPTPRPGLNASTVYNAAGGMRNLVDIVNNLSESYGRLAPREMHAALMQRGFTEGTATNISMLIRSRETLMEFVAMTARADGIMDQLYNKHMQSFSGQTTILLNNIKRFGIELGQTLIPYLLTVNALIIYLFERWNSLSDAAQHTIIALVGVGVALLALYFVLPLVYVMVASLWNGFLVLTNVLVTLVAIIGFLGLAMFTGPFWIAFNLIHDNLPGLVSRIQALNRVFWIATDAVGHFGLALIRAFIDIITITRVFFALDFVGHLRILWQAMKDIVTISYVFLSVGLLARLQRLEEIMWDVGVAAYAAVVAMYKWVIVNIEVVLAVFNTVMTIIVFNGVMVLFKVIILAAAVAVIFYGLSVKGLAVAHFLGSIATAAMTAATWALNIALTFLATVTGYILISIASLLAVLLVLVGVIGLVVYALTEVGNLNSMTGQQWENVWDNIVNFTVDAFWILIGLFYNFKENTQAIIIWIAQNWRLMVIDMCNIFETGMKNAAQNAGAFWLDVMKSNKLNPAAWFLPAAEYASPLANLPQMQTQPLLLNYNVPGNVREMVLDSIRRFSGGGSSGGAGGSIDSSGKVGDIYKEMSLRRFVLNTGIENQNRDIVQTNSPEANSLLERILSTLRDRGLGK